MNALHRIFLAWLMVLLPVSAAPSWELVAMNISKPTRGQSVQARLRLASQAGFTHQHELSIEQAVQGLPAYEASGMRLGAVYLILDAANGELPENFGESLKKLAAHRPQIWLAVSGPRAEAPRLDERVVERVRQVSDLAAVHGMRVAIYPHFNFYAETVAEALRIAKAARRDNVGICFNLCHFLRTEPGGDWKAALEQAGDRLFTVTISGADRNGKDWDTLIQPLDRGDFPLRDLLGYLEATRFSGLLGVQDFGIKEDPAETLARSHRAYQEMMARP